LRQAYARMWLVDQFPVFGPDGVSKVSGLQPSAFRTTVYRDAEVEGAVVEIAEIDGSPGEYRLSLSPHRPGLWEVEIACEAGRQVYAERYEVIEPVVAGGSRPPGWG